ncbi:inositol monophosphatase family protein [Micromonospora sp. NPDC001898]|uniref:inositol monophosphatase family protein n=1 Tax=Micromonospora sp. NPDC001898 TaxID=3364221 RepID=UPI0036BEB4EA
MTTIDVTRSAQLAEVAAEAATAVGDMLRGAFRSRPEVDYKRDRHDPVTVHDKAAEARIRDIVLNAEPDSRIVGEEGGAVGEGRVEWHVDPIDGTANFAHGLPFFCTSIGAVVDGRVVAGAIYDPLRDDLFTATLAGAWHNGEPLASVGAASEQQALLLTSYPSAREIRAAPERAVRRQTDLIIEYQTLRRIGSAALSLAHVATGWADAALGIGVSSWDVAAGSLLVTAAGGHYLGLRPNDVETDQAAWRERGYFATVGTLDPAGSTAIEAFADTHRAVPLT